MSRGLIMHVFCSGSAVSACYAVDGCRVSMGSWKRHGRSFIAIFVQALPPAVRIADENLLRQLAHARAQCNDVIRIIKCLYFTHTNTHTHVQHKASMRIRNLM